MSERPGAVNAALGVASDIVMSAALLALLVIGTIKTVKFISSGLRKNSGETPARLAQLLHVIYWVGSAATVCAAFWIAGEGATATHYSYYETVIFSIAAVLPLLLLTSPMSRWLIPACASVIFTASFVGLLRNYFELHPSPGSYAPTIVKIAKAEHVQVGYTNWADASGLTWGTSNSVLVRPLMSCPYLPVQLCPGFQALVASWYIPRERRTFLLVDTEGIDIRSVPPGLGAPIAVYRFGVMEMYIYPYDIASRIGPSIRY